jgi:hypothetical protein
VVDRKSDLVIEGYPGSANSFVRGAYLVANPDLEIASHLHTISHVERARSLHRPTLVLLREPEGSIPSHVARFLNGDVAAGLASYIRYYEKLQRITEGVVYATFQQATADLTFVTARLNDAFGISLSAPDVQDQQVRAHIDDYLEEGGRLGFGADSAALWQIGNEARAASLSAVKAELNSPRNEHLLAKARRTYENIALTRCGTS